jgi:hypothetical protein
MTARTGMRDSAASGTGPSRRVLLSIEIRRTGIGTGCGARIRQDKTVMLTASALGIAATAVFATRAAMRSSGSSAANRSRRPSIAPAVVSSLVNGSMSFISALRLKHATAAATGTLT